MQPPKRQIIKTRSQRPYIVARAVLIVIVVAAIVAAIYLFAHPHRSVIASITACCSFRQEAPGAGRTAEIPI